MAMVARKTPKPIKMPKAATDHMMAAVVKP